MIWESASPENYTMRTSIILVGVKGGWGIRELQLVLIGIPNLEMGVRYVSTYHVLSIPFPLLWL